MLDLPSDKKVVHTKHKPYMYTLGNQCLKTTGTGYMYNTWSKHCIYSFKALSELHQVLVQNENE